MAIDTASTSSSITGLLGSGSSAGAPALPSGLQSLSSAKAAAKAPSASDQLGQGAFLTLFTTQLQNQDPLDPVKNEAFVAQLAQFSQLEAATQMRDQMTAMAKTQQGERFMSGSNLIGKQVLPPDGPAHLVAGTSITGVVPLPSGADKVTLNVYDASGQALHSAELGRQPSGDLKVSWDGRDDQGRAQPSGDYRIVVTVNQGGKVSQVPVTTPATVRSVTWSSALDDMVLELEGGASVPISQVTRIDAAPTATTSATTPP